MGNGSETFGGGCLCGAIRYEAVGPLRVHYCHCSMCRKATGSAFAVLAWLDTTRLRWLAGQPRLFRSSPIARRGFCGNCGSALMLVYENSDETALHVGTFDRPDDAVPKYHYGSEGRLPWVDCGSSLPDHETEEQW